MRPRFLTRAPGSIVLGLLALGAVAIGLVSFGVQVESSPHFESLSAGGGQRALIVYHPSTIDTFQQDLTLSFAQGLQEAGWGVDRVTATSAAAPDLGPYALVAFGTNTYYWAMDWPTRRWIERAGRGLAGKVCAGLVSGFGATEQAERELSAALVTAGCGAAEVRPYWVMRPNDERDTATPNRDVALIQAREQGRRLGASAQQAPAGR
jgi:hypothetical protein